MKLSSPLPRKKGRIEIIPLIDIMFFLLAAFMIVSLNKIKVSSLKLNLPTDVPAAQKETKEDFISVSITAAGAIALDKQTMTNKPDLLVKLQQLYAKNKEQKFLISADRDAKNGDVIEVLGQIRAAGFQKIAFSVKPMAGGAPSAGASPAPAASPAAADLPSTAPVTTPESVPAAPSAPMPPQPAPTSPSKP